LHIPDVLTIRISIIVNILLYVAIDVDVYYVLSYNSNDVFGIIKDKGVCSAFVRDLVLHSLHKGG
jgi:hypothetical protein